VLARDEEFDHLSRVRVKVLGGALRSKQAETAWVEGRMRGAVSGLLG
jgi:hypothetical protein